MTKPAFGKCKQRAKSPKTKDTRNTYVVRVAQDLSEYADISVKANDSSDAEEIISELLDGNSLDNLDYARGDDREGPYTCDSWEMQEDEQVDCTIKDGIPVFTPKPADIIDPAKLTGTLTACPICGAQLHATVSINLYGVEIRDGRIFNYDGGPQPGNEENIVALCEPNNTTITCANKHLIANPEIPLPTASGKQ